MKVKEQMKIRFDFLHTGVSTFANPCKPNTQTKVCKRASTSPTREKLFFKISFPSKFFKTANPQPTRQTTAKNLTDDKNGSSQQRFGEMRGEVVN